jgi:hypothetical protein
MVLLAAGCLTDAESPAMAPSPTAAVAVEGAVHADVTAVSVAGVAGAYTFDVTVRSPDTGCDSYADWWEVVSPGGELLYRRVLLHSHVDEQPFSRSGGPVAVGPNDTVLVRAHMSTTGYGDAAFRGSVDGGFVAVGMSPGFGAGLAELGPLPSSCAFYGVCGTNPSPSAHPSKRRKER